MLRLVTSLLVLLAVPGLALAHGPSRQKVSETVEINAPLEKVWAVVGNFQDMSWHPAVQKTEGTGGNDAGATRTLTLEAGPIEEKLVRHDAERHMVKYEITKVDVKVLPVNNYSAIMTVSGDDKTSKVKWRAAFYRGYVNNDPPPELSDEAAVKAVTGVVSTGLAALKKKLEGN